MSIRIKIFTLVYWVLVEGIALHMTALRVDATPNPEGSGVNVHSLFELSAFAAHLDTYVKAILVFVVLLLIRLGIKRPLRSRSAEDGIESESAQLIP